MLCSNLCICFLSWRISYPQLNKTVKYPIVSFWSRLLPDYFLTCSFLESKLTSVLISPMGYRMHPTEKHEAVPFLSLHWPSSAWYDKKTFTLLLESGDIWPVLWLQWLLGYLHTASVWIISTRPEKRIEAFTEVFFLQSTREQFKLS